MTSFRRPQRSLPWREVVIGLALWVTLGVAIVRITGPATSAGNVVGVILAYVAVGLELLYLMHRMR